MKRLMLTLIFLVLAFNASALDTRVFSDFSDGTTTIDGTSTAMPVRSEKYVGTPFTVQITNSSSAAGAIQGLIYVNSGDDDDSTGLWVDLTDGTISGNGTFSFYAPFTHIRINLSSGTCQARILY